MIFRGNLEILSKIKIVQIKPDSGFYAFKFLKYFEGREVNYMVSVKLLKPIEQMVEGLSGWINLRDVYK